MASLLLSPEQLASYSAIIDSILASSDLNTISAKRVRKGLQEEVPEDLTPQKKAITDLILERYDKLRPPTEVGHVDVAPPPPPPPTKTAHLSGANDVTDGMATPDPGTPKRNRPSSDDDMSDVADSPPPAKKAKKSKSAPRASEVETDEQLAARLQAELNAQGARATRGGGTKRKTPAKKDKVVNKKKDKKKSAAKLNADDDSDLDAEGSDAAAAKTVVKSGGFHKPMNLSEPLAELLGESTLSRPQTVKKIWEYVKSRDMQDPNDKRQIMCDDKMRAVFKSDKVHMFTMNKVLAQHLYPVDEMV